MVVEPIISGQFNHPVCVVAFHMHENWAKDVTRGVGIRLLELNGAGREIGATAREFVERVTGEDRDRVVSTRGKTSPATDLAKQWSYTFMAGPLPEAAAPHFQDVKMGINATPLR